MNIRKDFPFLKENTFLDSGGGSLKPLQVVKSIEQFYLEYPINAHSGDSILGIKVSQKIEKTRELIASIVNSSKEEVIFTSGTTDSLNKIALMLEEKIQENDELLLSIYNHASHLVPWMELAKRKKAKVVFSKDILRDINSKTKIIAFASENNTLDQKLDIKEIHKKAKANNALVINDAAQAMMYSEVSLEDYDVIAFSGNKLFGPTGIGALVIKQDLLKTLKPVFYGGGSTRKIIDEREWINKDGVHAFENGTLNTAGIIGLGSAIKYFLEKGMKNIKKHVEFISNYAHQKLGAIEGIKFYSSKGFHNIIFSYKKYAGQDIVSYLGHKQIFLRAGLNCAKLIDRIIDEKNIVRISLGAYNNQDDIDQLVSAIKNGGDFLDFI